MDIHVPDDVDVQAFGNIGTLGNTNTVKIILLHGILLHKS